MTSILVTGMLSSYFQGGMLLPSSFDYPPLHDSAAQDKVKSITAAIPFYNLEQRTDDKRIT